MIKEKGIDRRHDIREGDIALAVSVLRGEMELKEFREKRKLTTSSCYSFIFRCMKEGIALGQIKIV